MTPDVIKGNLSVINNHPNEFNQMWDALKSYALKYTYYDGTQDTVKELTFNTNIRYSTGSMFVSILGYFGLLNRFAYSTGDTRIHIVQDLDLFETLQDFMYICNNEIPMKVFCRNKKIEKLKNGIKY